MSARYTVSYRNWRHADWISKNSQKDGGDKFGDKWGEADDQDFRVIARREIK